MGDSTASAEAEAGPRPGSPSVSVVIAAHDEERYLGDCLRSLAAQTYRPLEVIVVDDGSRDATAAVAARFPTVRLLRQAHLGAGSARNLGASRAHGDILVFVDGDMVLAPRFVDRLIAPMRGGGAVGTFTKDILMANPGRRWARAHVLGRNLDPQDPMAGVPDRWEIFRAVWRRDFERVGGFDDVGHGEDVTLGRKLGALAEAAPGATCWHHFPDTLPDVFRSARWYGRGIRIAEDPSWRARYGPLKSTRRALRMAWRHRWPPLLLYRLVWEAGAWWGWRTRERWPGAR